MNSPLSRLLLISFLAITFSPAACYSGYAAKRAQLDREIVERHKKVLRQWVKSAKKKVCHLDHAGAKKFHSTKIFGGPVGDIPNNVRAAFKNTFTFSPSNETEVHEFIGTVCSKKKQEPLFTNLFSRIYQKDLEQSFPAHALNCYVPERDLIAIGDRILGGVNTYGKENAAFAKKHQPACVSFFTNQFFKAEIVALKKKAKEDARRRRLAKEAAAAERKKAAEAAARKEQMLLARDESREALFKALSPSDNERVVWGSKNKHSGRIPGYANTEKIFDQVNLDYHNALARTAGKGELFSPPKRGEFEKTDAYEKRIADLKAKHVKQLADRQRRSVSEDAKIFAEVWGAVLGSPELLAVEYNADEEHFEIVVGKGEWEGVTGTLPVPITVAPAAKARYQKMTPWVILEKRGDSLSVVAIVLQKDDDLVEMRKVTMESPITFTAARKKAYAAKKAAEEKARAAELAEERKRRRASWPSGATASVRNGALVCAEIRDMLKAQVLERSGNPYVSMPGSCFNMPNTGYATEVREIQGGFVKFLLIGATQYGYTSYYSIDR